MSGLGGQLPTLSIEQIDAILSRRSRIGRRTVRHLLTDERAGVRLLGRRYLGRIREQEREAARLHRLLGAERELAGAGKRVIAGLDEAGVAPIAGPVVAAAVVLPDGWIPAGLHDSKRLDPGRREHLDREIRGTAIAIGVGIVSERVIDIVNIYQASLMAMRLALQRLGRPVDLALLDGRPPRTFPVPHRAVVRGDGRVRAIAAASVIAKVARDRLLVEADRRWPDYGFASHKGYMTRAHIEALRAHGLSPIHRLSFPRVWEEADAMGPLYRELLDRLERAESAAEMEAVEFVFDAARAALHPSEERLLQRLLEARRGAVAELAAEP
ncbi:MAG TPA: ribonuclease HII [Gemmatimonadota bacterium]|nr:ribonuclease HII [Gemmatimonadota bacterium]